MSSGVNNEITNNRSPESIASGDNKARILYDNNRGVEAEFCIQNPMIRKSEEGGGRIPLVSSRMARGSLSVIIVTENSCVCRVVSMEESGIIPIKTQ